MNKQTLNEPANIFNMSCQKRSLTHPVRYLHRSGMNLKIVVFSRKEHQYAYAVLTRWPLVCLKDLLHLPLQGSSAGCIYVGSGDPVRVLRLSDNGYTGYTLKHLLLRHMYNLPLPKLRATLLADLLSPESANE